MLRDTNVMLVDLCVYEEGFNIQIVEIQLLLIARFCRDPCHICNVAILTRGICITDDDTLAEKIYRAKHIGYADGSVQGAASNGPPADLLCHNFRATAFQAVILSDQLAGLSSRIEQYNASRDLIESYVRNAAGIRMQPRGRLADPQGYYALAFMFDEEPMAGIPLEVIHQAINAEGLLLNRTYGPVYKHVLYTLPPNQYRVADGGCPVADAVAGTRTLTLPHQWLMADQQTIRSIGEILVSVADRHRELASGRY